VTVAFSFVYIPMKRLQKRFLDFFFSLVAIIVLSPLLIGVALMVWIKIGRPILFRQPRPGMNGKPFNMLKFRTMRDAIGTDGQPLPDSERLLPFGKFLRSTSLDELPGVFNILKGDMSFVGPRPLLMEYLPLYSPFQARRHEMRPGITGWAQVNGRNAITWDQKFEYDVWYVENYSLWLDIKICWMTFLKVVKRADINAESEATMPKFGGPGS